MSIRVTVLTFIVLGLSIYAWRNWFRALCGAIVLMAFLEHPDMPRHIFGIRRIQSLESAAAAMWSEAGLVGAAPTGVARDMPQNFAGLSSLYVFVIVWAFLRMFRSIRPAFMRAVRRQSSWNILLTLSSFSFPAFSSMMVAARGRMSSGRWGQFSCMYLLLVLAGRPLHGSSPRLFWRGISRRAAKVINNSVGYNRVDMSMMLAGASWAVIAFSGYASKTEVSLAPWGAAGFILLAQAMTGGRTGYVTWGVLGLVLCVIKWRKLLPLIPLAVVVIVLAPARSQAKNAGRLWWPRRATYVEQTNSIRNYLGKNVTCGPM